MRFRGISIAATLLALGCSRPTSGHHEVGPAAASSTAQPPPEPSSTPVVAGPAARALCGALFAWPEGKCERDVFDRAIAADRASLCARYLAHAVESGHASLEPRAADECAAVARDGGGVTGACESAVVGHQKEGQPCRSPWECAGALACSGDDDGDGTCRAVPAAGEGCQLALSSRFPGIAVDFAGHPPCARGSICEANGKCRALSADGQSCKLQKDCLPGLTCHVGQCRRAALAAAGDPCTYSSECRAPLYCTRADASSRPGTCAPMKRAGAACTRDPDPCLGRCAHASGATTGTCAPVCDSG